MAKQDFSPRLSNDEDEYYVVPAIPVDEEVHTPDRPFCDDLTCPCHEDQEAIQATGQQVLDGLLTPNDADGLYRGKTLLRTERNGCRAICDTCMARSCAFDKGHSGDHRCDFCDE